MRDEYDLKSMKATRRRDAGKALPVEATSPRNIKIRISILLDADILAHFKQQAAQPGAALYQTQINGTLRAAIEGRVDVSISVPEGAQVSSMEGKF